jgi:HlyD family secretion protein
MARGVFIHMTHKTLLSVMIAAVATISVGAWYSRHEDAGVMLTTAAVTRGSLVSTVSATGTLQPVTTVQVGAQVSGIIESLPADFNSIVRKGQVLATLDRSTFASSLEQARASLVNAQAEAERQRVARTAADAALARAQELASRDLLPAQDLQSAQTDSRTAAAQVAGADAKVRQAKAAVDSAQVDLAKTVIMSPIDGVVTARNVDVGQTVSASFSAPTLFVIAADLSKMQVNANVDESDVGQVAAGQAVTFHVDAYPTETFRGTVSEVRLDAATVNNVVTYAAIIDAPNADLTLKPGMTANATIEVARRDNVLRVPSAALRFKPDASVLAQYAGGAPAPNVSAGKIVWVMNGTTIAPVSVQSGASDATNTEVTSPSLSEGAMVVTRAASASSSSSAAPAATGNPLLPSRPTFGRR